jgi:uncharacterized OB-fold protein
MSRQVPLVSYLVLDERPHLIARQCRQCGARFFDRRNACASCGSQAGFDDIDLPDEGVLRTFTIVSVAAPGVPVPYAASVVDLAGTGVRANLVNVKPDPASLALGMRVRLSTFSMGTDAAGVEAIGFGFEPVEQAEPAASPEEGVA